MRHIKLENGIPINYSIEELLVDVPDAIIYHNTQMPNPTLLANYSVYPLVTTARPTLNEDETIEEGQPEFKDGEWYQTWVVRQLTAEEIQQIIDDRTAVDESTAKNSAEAEASLFLANNEVQISRYDICKACPSFTVLKTCKECGCIMPLKVKIANANCPLGKW
jgi:hypothetical protein